MASGPAVSRVIGDIDHRRTRRLLGLMAGADGTAVLVWSLHTSRRHTAAISRARRHLIARGFVVETDIGDPAHSFGPCGRVILTVTGSVKR